MEHPQTAETLKRSINKGLARDFRNRLVLETPEGQLNVVEKLIEVRPDLRPPSFTGSLNFMELNW